MNATARYTPERAKSGADAEQRRRVRCGSRRVGTSGGQGGRAQRHARRRLRRRGAYPGDYVNDYVAQAVLIAKQMPGTPVKMIWSREDDMAARPYHPVMQCKLTGGLDASGNLSGLHMRLSGQSILASVRPEIVQAQKGRDPVVFQGVADSGEHSFSYTIPNLLVDHAMRNTHVPPGFWRGVNINQNAIFMECFMDELAEAAGQDALEFRRKLMAKYPRNLAVLNAVAERIGWSKPAPQGMHRGLAHMKAFDSFVAAACEISVTDGNKVKVHRIVAGDRPRLRGQSGADRAPGLGLVRLRALGAVLPGVHGQGRAHRAVELARLQLDAHSRRCRKWKRS
jgi:isoquinoline 1-oxidoreductase beta subunit